MHAIGGKQGERLTGDGGWEREGLPHMGIRVAGIGCGSGSCAVYNGKLLNFVTMSGPPFWLLQFFPPPQWKIHGLVLREI